MAKKLFVRNLPWSVREDDLRAFVEGRGIACEKVEVVMERDSDRSRGFGFLHFDSDAAADEAIHELNNSDLDGRTIYVEEARPSPGRGGGGGGGKSGGRPGRGRRDRDDRGGRRGGHSEW